MKSNPFAQSDSNDESLKSLEQTSVSESDGASTLYLGGSSDAPLAPPALPVLDAGLKPISLPRVEDSPASVSPTSEVPASASPSKVPLTEVFSAVSENDISVNKYTVAMFLSGNDKQSIERNTQIVIDLMRLGKFDSEKIAEEIRKPKTDGIKQISKVSLKDLVRDLLVVSHNKAVDITGMARGVIDLDLTDDSKLLMEKNKVIQQLLDQILTKLTPEQKASVESDIRTELKAPVPVPAPASVTQNGGSDFKTIKNNYHDIVVRHNEKLERISQIAQKILTVM